MMRLPPDWKHEMCARQSRSRPSSASTLASAHAHVMYASEVTENPQEEAQSRPPASTHLPVPPPWPATQLSVRPTRFTMWDIRVMFVAQGLPWSLSSTGLTEVTHARKTIRAKADWSFPPLDDLERRFYEFIGFLAQVTV